MTTTSLMEFASRQQQSYDASTDPADRKLKGHFGTPPAIAEFMARLVPRIPRGHIDILDPGAGVGTLTAALCDRIARSKSSREVNLELWENDPPLIQRLEQTMDQCKRVLAAQGHSVQWTIHVGDFVLSHNGSRLFGTGNQSRFQFVIMNPPYYKLRKDSVQARAMPHVVHGQPNIYALFMALGVDLLTPDGYMVAITPRSYFNGPYFRSFRLWFLKRMTPVHVHLFESRADVFRNDKVLQENVILCARKSAERGDVVLTTSIGRDFRNAVRRCRVPFSSVVPTSNRDAIIRVTACPIERRLIGFMDRLPNRLRDLGLDISTGPVVAFRAARHLLDKRDGNRSAPLLWLHNVRPFQIRFGRSNGKAAHIRVSAASRKLLLPARRYLLLRRFAAKEERRRLVAAVFDNTQSYSHYIGLENHLNYIHHPGGELATDEAIGLAAVLNSVFVDRYFRAISGNTQINAAEIRALPLPDLANIVKLGGAIRQCGTEFSTANEHLTGRALGLPEELIDSLCKAEE